MILSVIAGLAGSTGSALAERGSMAGMGSVNSPDQVHTGANSFLALLNPIAVPLLLVSILLMFTGVARAGWRALGLVVIGSVLLMVNMFASTSALAAAWFLGGGYLLIFLGYMVAWKGAGVHRAASST
jgi:hypothetical protein